MKTRFVFAIALLFLVLDGINLAAQGNSPAAQSTSAAQSIDLPTSKQLMEEIPGKPQRLNSLPISMAVSPDKRYVVTINAGYGTFESKYDQSLAVLDTETGTITDFPDVRTQARRAKQTLYSGLAFSPDGSHIYASMGSITDPTGEKEGTTGNGIIVYKFESGKVTTERFIKLPLQQLGAGQKTRLINERDGDKAIPFPAAIAVFKQLGGEQLLVAGNLSDDVLLIDAATGQIAKRFDLSSGDAVPGTYPIAITMAPDGQHAYVALWNSSEIVELDIPHRTVGRKLALLKSKTVTAPGSHPCAIEVSPDGKNLFVALANRDAVAIVNIESGQFKAKGFFDTRLPGQEFFGAEPVALAVNADGSRLYVANMASDAVAVFDARKLPSNAKKPGLVDSLGFIPTEWMPISMAFSKGKLYVATDKGRGTGPNNMPQRQTEEMKARNEQPGNTYIATLLYGSLASIDEASVEKNLSGWTRSVITSNRMKAAEEKITFAGGATDRIKHVIYIIKENRTYDQVLGDLKSDGKRVGNGDDSLTMYGEDITPNLHKLALQFGVVDNFYDSGEVSGDGHVWSNAAIGTDYLEKNWQIAYRGGQRFYDFEGSVADGYPLLQKIPDVNEPASGYLWGNLAAHNKTYYHFGEFISTIFCTDEVKDNMPANPQEGPMMEGRVCDRKEIAPGAEIPEQWGGGVNKWPWAIPLIAANTATKQELVGHFAAEAPDFNLRVPDQIRVEIFLRHLKQWVADKQQGKDTMPNYILLRLPNDHTEGTRPGGPTPKASVADNDLAVGRAVDAISHSPFWDDTAFFVLEDDAQAGADHVDAHRSVVFVVSKYAPHAKDGGPYVDSRFYTTVSVLRTMETLLGLPPMNNNDALSSMISPLFTGPGDQPAYSADFRNRDNNLIFTANKKTAPGAEDSMKMDFRHADRADTRKLNVILWKDAKGSTPVPASLKAKIKRVARDDDDD